MFSEIQGLQNLAIIPFSVDVESMHILNTVSFENLGESTPDPYIQR